VNALKQPARRRLWTVPNLLTILRIALTGPFLFFITSGRFGAALGIFFLASVTDFFDGYAARKLNQQSDVGRLLDPLADKLLTTAGFVVLAIPHAGLPTIPVWVAATVVGRDALILLGALVIYAATRFTGFRPSLLGKVNTLIELGMIVMFLAFNALGVLTFLLPAGYWLTMTSVVVSGVEYAIRGVSILRAQPERASRASSNGGVR
jgi:cardiolipin synthase (CMP-forming)